MKLRVMEGTLAPSISEDVGAHASLRIAAVQTLLCASYLKERLFKVGDFNVGKRHNTFARLARS